MKVLLITYYYPPMGGAGVQRALKFSKYLGEFGITPVVLAAHDPSYTRDESLLAEVPSGMKVLRIEHRPLLQRLLARRTAHAAAKPAAGSARATGSRRLRDAALGAYAAIRFPDDKADWARRAFEPALALLRDEGIDLIFSTAPPMSTHALAFRLAQRTGLPWVADYRDLWTENPGYVAPGWRRALDRRTEAAWLRRAAGIVTVTPSWQQAFAQRLGAACPAVCIPNGYDEADFEALPTVERTDDAFRLVHTGSFYGPRDPGTLLDGVAAYLRAAAPSNRRLVLRLVGSMGQRFAQRLARFEIEHPGVIEHLPYRPHREALLEMQAADALLLVVGAGQGVQHGAVVAGTLPGKVFEYLRADRPILLLGDEHGDAAQLVRQHAAGWIADETRPERIAHALHEMMRPGTSPARPSTAEVVAFERRALAGELAGFLRRCRAAHHG